MQTKEDLQQSPEENPYGQHYYNDGFGAISYERNDFWLAFFNAAADQIIRSLKPKRVWDAGCAMGMLVESFWDRGVESWGVDISEYAIAHVRRDMQAFCFAGSITDPLPQAAASLPFDLVTCIEVLEHLPPDLLRPAVERLSTIADRIFFSSTPNDMVEATHYSVRPTIFWLKLFAEFGYSPDFVYDASFVAPHAILLRRDVEPTREDGLLLFADRLRLKVALVEREARIGRLNAEAATAQERLRQTHGELTALNQQLHDSAQEGQRLRSETVRLSASVSAIEFEATRAAEMAAVLPNLRQQAARVPALEAQVDALTAEAAAAQDRHEQLVRDHRALARHHAHIAQEAAANDVIRQRLADAIPELEATVRQFEADRRQWVLAGHAAQGTAAENERLSDALTLFRHQLFQAAKLLAENAGQEARLREELARQQQEFARAQAELDTIHNSPGWAAILRYRRLLGRVGLVGKEPESVAHVIEPQVASAPLIQRPLPPPATLSAPLPAYLPPAVPAPSPAPPVSLPQPPTPVAFPYADWVRATAPTQARIELERDLARNLAYRPLLSVLVPIYKVPAQVVREMVESVLQQTYTHWELCIVHAHAEDREVADLLTTFAGTDPRIRLRTLPENLGISGNSNQALELVNGEFLALLDHDDLLATSALFEIAVALNENPSLGFLYSDKDQLDEALGERVDPLFKPQWSPEIMLSANYLTHLCVMRTATVRAVGAWRKETDGAQDWDLFLRVIRAGATVRHIPKVLYHWRRIATSVALGGVAAKPYVTEAQRFCLRDHLRETGWHAEPVLLESGYWKLTWDQEFLLPVSVLIDFRSATPETARAHGAMLLEATRYPQVEFVFATESAPAEDVSPGHLPPENAGHIRFVSVPPGSTPQQCFQALADSCTSPWLVFLDPAVIPQHPEWLEELAGPLQQAGIGIVGPKLLDASTGLLRHTGIAFNRDGSPGNLFAHQPEQIYNQFGAANWYRNFSAVSGACFAIRHDDWLALNGFESPLDYPRFDVDLCLRLQFERGLRILYNPFSRLLQHQTAALEEWQSSSHWGDLYFRTCSPAGDPYFNPNLLCREGSVELPDPLRKQEPAPLKDQARENRELVAAFDFGAHQLAASREATSRPATGHLKRLTWIVPDFTVAFYGGIHTILRFAESFLRHHAVHSDFLFLGHAHPEIIRQRIASAFPVLGAEAGVIKVRSYGQLESLAESDATISTLWTTAYAALSFNRTRRKFYFVQDYEPLFYAAGSVSALTEATYGFGFTGLCNTVELQRRYVEHGSPAEYFTPSIDTSVFFPAAHVPHEAGEEGKARHEAGEEEKAPQPGRPYRLFCYARPSHARNCFELLAAALRKLKERFGPDLEIVTAGAEWDAAAEGLDGVVQNVGLLGYRETGALYRSCDAGVVMMMTAHPSYLPLELMACGALVITNRNPATRWLLADEENCLLAAPTATAFAERIETGLRDSALRRRITANALAMVQARYTDWEGQAEKIYEYIQSAV